MVKSRAIVVSFVVFAACGRTGFDERAASDAAPDAAPTALACEPSRFSMATTTTAVAAGTSTDGYFVFAVDAAGNVAGSAFQFPAAGPTLAQTADGVKITSDATGSAAGVALDDGVLVAVPYGRPDATGTALIPLTSELTARGAPVPHDKWIAGPGMLARAANTTVLLGQDASSRSVAGQIVDASGNFIGSPLELIPGSTSPQTATLIAAGDRFLATWGAAGASTIESRAQLFDSQLVPKSEVITISHDATNGVFFPRAAYAPGADRYLFAWYVKVNGGMDQLWISLRDGSLNEITTQVVSSQGSHPVIAAGDDSFLLVWQAAGPTLSAARISAKDGTPTALGVTNTGGTSSGWDVVSRAGQPALVWVEAGGTGPNLWLNPLCN